MPHRDDEAISGSKNMGLLRPDEACGERSRTASGLAMTQGDSLICTLNSLLWTAY